LLSFLAVVLMAKPTLEDELVKQHGFAAYDYHE
jgi:hypothetical protein